MAAAARPRPRKWLLPAAGAAAAIAQGIWVARGWLGGERSHDLSRLRIAEVKRGDLVRDLSAEGRVIAELAIRLNQIIQRGHQRFWHKSPAATEMYAPPK